MRKTNSIIVIIFNKELQIDPVYFIITHLLPTQKVVINPMSCDTVALRKLTRDPWQRKITNSDGHKIWTIIIKVFLSNAQKKLMSDLISNLQFRSQLWIRCTVQIMQSVENKKNEIFKWTTTDWSNNSTKICWISNLTINIWRRKFNYRWRGFQTPASLH